LPQDTDFAAANESLPLALAVIDILVLRDNGKGFSRDSSGLVLTGVGRSSAPPVLLLLGFILYDVRRYVDMSPFPFTNVVFDCQTNRGSFWTYL
jgi:hypothetical protein